MTKRQLFIGVLSTLIILSVIVYFYPSQEPVAQVRLLYFKGSPNYALYVPVEKGFYEGERVNVTLVPTLGGTATMISMLIAGEADAAVVSTSGAILSIARGAPIKMMAVGVFDDREHPSSLFVTASASSIRSVKDLKGCTIGVNEIGDIGHILLLVKLRENGVDPRDVNIVPIPFPLQFDALRTGRTQVGLFVEPFYTMTRQKLNATVILTYNDVIENIVVSALVFSDRFYNENPNALKRFMNAYVSGAKWGRANPLETTGIISKYTEIPKNVTDEMIFPLVSTEVGSGPFGPSLQKLINTMYEYRSLTGLESNLTAKSLFFRGYSEASAIPFVSVLSEVGGFVIFCNVSTALTYPWQSRVGNNSPYESEE